MRYSMSTKMQHCGRHVPYERQQMTIILQKASTISLRGAHYLFKTVKHQWKDGWFQTFSFGRSEGTSTSKAVACAVISIAGSVTTQPTAQTTTSASTWPKKSRNKRSEKCSFFKKKKCCKISKRKRGASKSHDPFGGSWRMSVFWPPRSPSAQTWIRGKPRPSGSASPSSSASSVSATKRPFPLLWPMIWSCGARASEGGGRRVPAQRAPVCCRTCGL